MSFNNSTNNRLNFAVYKCFSTPFDQPDCIRTSILCAFFFLTFLLCIALMIRMIITRQMLSYQMLILGLAIIQMFLGILHSVALPSTIFDFFLGYLKLLQLCAISFYFSKFALSMGNLERYQKLVLWPLFGFSVLLITVAVIIASSGILTPSDKYECIDPSYIILDSCGLFLTVIFLGVSIFLLRQLRRMRISETIKAKKRKGLLILLTVYIVTNLIAVGWDIGNIIWIKSKSSRSCDDQGMESTGEALSAACERIVNLLFPVWAVLFVFNHEIRLRTDKPNPGEKQPMLRMTVSSSSQQPLRHQWVVPLVINDQFESDQDPFTD